MNEIWEMINDLWKHRNQSKHEDMKSRLIMNKLRIWTKKKQVYEQLQCTVPTNKTGKLRKAAAVAGQTENSFRENALYIFTPIPQRYFDLIFSDLIIVVT